MQAHPRKGPSVEIYTGPQCTYCVRAKSLLGRKGISYVELDISTPQNRLEMAQRLPRARSIPQIFIDGKHVGGCEDLELLDSHGGLDAMIDQGAH
jgi:glutaredoxin 3